MPDALFFFIALCLAIAVFCLLTYLKREFFDPRGASAPKATTRILEKFAFLRRFKVLSGVRVGDGPEIENMLIGYFGVLIVRTLGAKGDFYGTLSGEKWAVVANDRKTQFDNPVLLMQKQAAALRAVFSANKLYNIPIECVVYISSKSAKTTVSITNNGEILMPGKLAGYLRKTRFEKDLGFDVDQIQKAVADLKA